MRGFDDATGSRRKSQRMSDFADMVEWPSEYKSYRMIGPLFSVCYYWFTIATDRRPEGVSIPKQCLDHDGNTDKMVTDVCPYRKSGLGREGKSYFINVIDREEQEGRDADHFRPPRGARKEEHLGYEAYWAKAGDSKRTPVRLLEIPDSQIDKLKSFKKLNKYKNADGVVMGADISNPKYGCDISILFDPSKKGPARYDIQKGERTPLTREEREYMLYRPDLMKPERLEEAKREMEELAGKIVKKKRDGKGRDGDDRGGRRRPREEVDDPLMEDSTVRLHEDDLDEPPRRRRRDEDADYRDDPHPRRRRDSRDEDEEDVPFDLDSDLEDDGDDRPAKPQSADRDDYDEPPRRSQSRREDDDRPRRRAAAPSRRTRDDEDAEYSSPRRSRDEDYDSDGDEDYGDYGRRRGRR